MEDYENNHQTKNVNFDFKTNFALVWFQNYSISKFVIRSLFFVELGPSQGSSSKFEPDFRQEVNRWARRHICQGTSSTESES